ncbi:MAG: hypothetical protein RLZZ28_1124 [Bacteroidota bacterium]
MVDLDLQIKSIQEKLQLLLKQQAMLQKDRQRLQKELEKAISENKDQFAAIQALQQQVDIAKLGSGSLSQEDKTGLSKRIDAYLKEIDKCLALLNE